MLVGWIPHFIGLNFHPKSLIYCLIENSYFRSLWSGNHTRRLCLFWPNQIQALFEFYVLKWSGEDKSFHTFCCSKRNFPFFLLVSFNTVPKWAPWNSFRHYTSQGLTFKLIECHYPTIVAWSVIAIICFLVFNHQNRATKVTLLASGCNNNFWNFKNWG
jgi:hypothetical protein